MFEVAHALVRQGLSVYADVPEIDWSFQRNQWGRPEVAGPARAPRFTFSLSHTPGLVACAISVGVECGVDVESVARGGQTRCVSHDGCCPSGRSQTSKRSPAETKLERLLEYWTLKEAYLKARGVGMSVAMRDVSFVLDEREIRLVAVDPEATSGPGAWSFTSARPTLSHVLALALGPPDGPSRTVVMREGLPMEPAAEDLLLGVEFHAAVQRTAFVGVVRRDRPRLSEALRRDSARGDTAVDEVLANRLCTAQTETLVVVVVTDRVGVAFDAHRNVRASSSASRPPHRARPSLRP